MQNKVQGAALQAPKHSEGYQEPRNCEEHDCAASETRDANHQRYPAMQHAKSRQICSFTRLPRLQHPRPPRGRGLTQNNVDVR